MIQVTAMRPPLLFPDRVSPLANLLLFFDCHPLSRQGAPCRFTTALLAVPTLDDQISGTNVGSVAHYLVDSSVRKVVERQPDRIAFAEIGSA
jgi:hypothetical protein